METIEELGARLKLTPSQLAEISKYFNGLVVELLNSLKDDTAANFDETIDNLSS